MMPLHIGFRFCKHSIGCALKISAVEFIKPGWQLGKLGYRAWFAVSLVKVERLLQV